MKTAVEWLVSEISRDRVGQAIIKTFLEEFEQAKELEKQQMESCAIFFTNYAIDKIENKTNLKGEEQFEQYYNETFNK